MNMPSIRSCFRGLARGPGLCAYFPEGLKGPLRRIHSKISSHLTKSTGIIFFLFLILLKNSTAAEPRALVTGIRHWSSEDYTRVVIDLSRKASFEHHLLKKDPSKKKPRRLYIDISTASIDKNLERVIPINDGLLKKVRTGQHTKKTVRVVLDIESIRDYNVFPLSDPFRIVIDVTGERRAPVRDSAGGEVVPTISEQLGLKVKTIVIDPGHGGKDPGAIGRRGLKEKDITLKIARMLRAELKKKLDAKIILTRDRDVFIPLEERTAIANSKGADLFISIHVNASPRRGASGVETYFLGITNDRDTMRLAARENSTNTKSMSDLEYILNDLIRTAKTNESSRLASRVQSSLVTRLSRRYKGVNGNGVKGAPFYVLMKAGMPSILVEVSFISNPREEKRLRDERYLKEIVRGISTGILEYINRRGVV